VRGASRGRIHEHPCFEQDLALFRGLKYAFSNRAPPIEDLRRLEYDGVADRLMGTVAVILCNFNHARYLPESLGTSVVRQGRRSGGRDDDGSTDDSWRIIETFAREHSTYRRWRTSVISVSKRDCQGSGSRALRLSRLDAATTGCLPRSSSGNRKVLARYPGAALSFSEVVVLKRRYGGDRSLFDQSGSSPNFDLSGLPRICLQLSSATV